MANSVQNVAFKRPQYNRYSASNRNEYQQYFMGVTEAGA